MVFVVVDDQIRIKANRTAFKNRNCVFDSFNEEEKIILIDCEARCQPKILTSYVIRFYLEREPQKLIMIMFSCVDN